LRGKTLMPGLIDSHYHRIGGSGGTMGISALKLPNPAFSDRSSIAYGVTTAWEPGGPWNDGAPALVDLREAGRIQGPRWSYSGPGGRHPAHERRYASLVSL
jgi:imidazolonepropionase-like amidohydrolase